jgi:membrane fusion protein
MNDNPLFRQEVFDSKKNSYYGSVIINTPVSFEVVTWCCSLLVVLIGLFLALSDYSEKFIVTGYLNSTQGLVRVYPTRNGVIVTSRVAQGSRVHQGDELFVINTAYDGMPNKDQSAVLSNLDKRKKVLEGEIVYKRKQLGELQHLLTKKYISLETYNNKHAELVALDKEKNALEMERIHYEQNRSYTVRAPVNGVISSVIYKEGQYTNLTKPLVIMLPDKAELQAELYVPVKQSGFLKKNNALWIRYDAFPYARFGSYPAEIREISQNIMLDEEDDKPLTVGQPYYKITAKLASQFVRLYGQPKKLKHGMTLSAVIVGEKRKIWQWILDPIYSFYGGIMS